MVLNVFFQNKVVGNKTYNGQLSDNFDHAEFCKLVNDVVEENASEMYRFIVEQKDLKVTDKDEFDKLKHMITNSSTILLLRRMRGGIYVETGILFDIILQELPGELSKLKTVSDKCLFCLEDDQSCVKFCCTALCLDCFSGYFKDKDLKLKCMLCPTVVSYKSFFVASEFIRSLESLDEIRGLVKFIDCQICHCGALLINDTFYSQQTCDDCKRVFCFFCNKDWNQDGKTRRNDLYTCHVNCDYETMVTFELVDYHYSEEFKIPNKRCCPECCSPGGYDDDKCKYHVCLECNHEFCFLCLKSKADCFTDFNSLSYKCADPKPQEYKIFPYLGK